jgi:GNAT superfamily N-acetyltransferase
MSLILESDRFLKGVERMKNRSQSGVYPVVHIEYLAVTSSDQGRGLGTDMMSRALLSYRRAVDEIGAPALTLVALNDGLMAYYRKLGFFPYASHTGQRRMMLTAQQVIAATAGQT